ncbi:hypothetical protein [Pantoea agglomerans]|uniref:hypothetical protein n=1 Tax=Enterobacter agglomerans TaxID=549 RepID=UPI003C7E7CB2
MVFLKRHKNTMRALSLKTVAFICCHALSEMISHKKQDDVYRVDINELKDSARMLRERILMKSKLDLKDNYNASEVWLGVDFARLMLDEYYITYLKEKKLSKKKGE